MVRILIAVFLFAAVVHFAAAAPAGGSAIVVQDQAALRASPRDAAQQQAVLWQGEVIEVRGERLDYLQVWDHRRERGGFIRASQVRRTALAASEAPELLSVVRFVRETPGSEALGIGFVAAFLQAAPAEAVNGEPGIEALDALGTFADRLAKRASSGAALSKSAQAATSAHLEVAARYGVKFATVERDDHVQICYDGEAFRRVLAMKSNAQQRARAALGLTRPGCVSPDLSPSERLRLDEWKAEVLERVDVAALPAYLANRVLMRRASIWASLAYQRARKGEGADVAGQRALAAMTGIDKSELADEDIGSYAAAAMRVNVSRWSVVPAQTAIPAPGGNPGRSGTGRPHVVTTPGQPGETCITLVDDKRGAANPLAKRCTYGLVYPESATLNREGNALALAVQPLDTWRELWVFRKEADGWTVSILPPAPTSPDVGYVEFAGWVPGGTQMLVAREAKSEGKYKRSFEVVRLDTLSTERQASEPTQLAAFQRWKDPAWKRMTLSVR